MNPGNERGLANFRLGCMKAHECRVQILWKRWEECKEKSGYCRLAVSEAQLRAKEGLGGVPRNENRVEKRCEWQRGK